MTDHTASPPSWDLEQYSTKARMERRAAESAAAADPAAVAPPRSDAVQPLEEYIAAKDDGDWLAPAQRKTRPRYVDSGSVFWIAFFGTLLSFLTLGLYRFWMLTGLRRAYCGSIRVDGDPIEYTGNGWEKLIGFLIAITMLAVYVAFANLALTFGGIVALDAGALLTPWSLIAIAPFWFWAQYRAQRYVMARLNWRAIRFRMDPGAFGYAWRSVVWALVTLLTLGLAYPYMHFAQARYMAERSYLGTLRLKQEGSWLGLMAHWIRLYITIGLMFLAFWGLSEEMRLDEEAMRGWLVFLAPIALFVMFYVVMAYRIGAFRYLWDNRTLGGARIENDVKVRSIIFAYVRGSIGVSLMSGVVTVLAAVVFIGLGYAAATQVLDVGAFIDADGDISRAAIDILGSEDVPRTPVLIALSPIMVGIVLTYLVFMAASFAFTETLVTQPILRRKVEAMLVRNPDALGRAAQAERVRATEAGGFADALGVDMGAGFG